MADVDELARRLEAAKEQQRAIGRVLRAVARAEGLQPVLDAVVQAATGLSGVENGRLFLVEHGFLRAFANHGIDETFEYDRDHAHPIDRTSLAGRAALTRAPVHIADVVEDPEYTYAGPRPYRAGLSVPIIFEDELIHRLRGPLRLRRARAGHKSRVEAEHEGGSGPDPDQPARARGGRGPGHGRARRRARPEGLRSAGDGLRGQAWIW